MNEDFGDFGDETLMDADNFALEMNEQMYEAEMDYWDCDPDPYSGTYSEE